MVRKEFDQSSTQPNHRIRRRRGGRIKAAIIERLWGGGSQRYKSKTGATLPTAEELAQKPPKVGKGWSLKLRRPEKKKLKDKDDNQTGALVPNSARPQKNQGRSLLWGWHLLGLSLLVAFTSLGAMSLRWLLTMPPPIDCDALSVGSADRDRLYCIQNAAKTGELDQLVAGIELVESWPSDHPLRGQGDKLVGEWSALILDLARQKFLAGDLNGANAIAEKIPKTNPVYAQVEQELQIWEADWDKGKAIYDQAQAALKARNWSAVEDQMRDLLKLDNVYWRSTRYAELQQGITAEKQAWKQLEDARYLVYTRSAEELVRAIDLARQINPQRLVREEANKEINRWSSELLAIAKDRFKNGNFNGAISAAKWIPSDTTVYGETQDLITLSSAQSLVHNDKPAGPIPERLFTYLEASTLAGQIQSDSPLYSQAQENLARWTQHKEDLFQVQMANSVASFRHPLLMQLAIAQAQIVGMDRPGRLDAQTPIAQWRKEIEQIEDRGYVVAAKAIADSSNITALKNAIGSAQQVAQGRPLRIEAQTLIAQWNKQVQTLEDQPILASAQALAQAGQLQQAINEAKKIGSSRALYKEASQNIGKWVSEIQIAEDQPILDQAATLAAQGSLGKAIDTAAKIGSGRALYSEARTAISRWNAQLDAIYAAREAEAARSSSSSYQAPAPVYQEPAPVYQEPAPVYQEPAPVYQEPAAVYQEPAPVYQEPEPYYQEPVYQEPAPVYQEPEPYYEEPEPYYEPPAAAYQAPEPYYEEPTSYYEEPAPAYEDSAPASSAQDSFDALPVDGIE